MMVVDILRNPKVRKWIDRGLFLTFIGMTLWILLFQDNTPPEEREMTWVGGPGFYDTDVLQIAHVKDGDELEVENFYQQRTTMRLAGVKSFAVDADHPQAALMGQLAANYLTEHVKGREARLRTGHQKTDKRYRLLGRLHLLPTEADPRGGSVGLALLYEGLVMFYPTDALAEDTLDSYRTAEQTARDAGKGLWANPQLIQLVERMQKQWIATP
ncbi:MAG TPA: hypothetical protein DCR55_16210 [Lentisphaeria bacterium]|jgi:endonuclease YncB( thermonuclease family)|nr:hypothetical protein [Lentisphaeria bacterium]